MRALYNGAWEDSLQRLAEQAALQRSVALSAVSSHVEAVAELVRARAGERERHLDGEITSMIETFRQELNGLLDRLAATRPGS